MSVLNEVISSMISKIKRAWRWRDLFAVAMCVAALAGCQSQVKNARTLNALEQQNLDRAKSLWDKNQKPLGEECEKDYEKFLVASYETLEEMAKACGTPNAVGCFFNNHHGFLGLKYNPTIVYWAKEVLSAVMLHEFTHWALICTENTADYYHTKKEIWKFVNDNWKDK